MSGRGNGLSAASYKPLIDLHPRLADAMLDALAESGVAAYAAPALRPFVADLYAPVLRAPVDRLWVDATAEDQARGVLDRQLPALKAEFEQHRPSAPRPGGAPRLVASSSSDGGDWDGSDRGGSDPADERHGEPGPPGSAAGGISSGQSPADGSSAPAAGPAGQPPARDGGAAGDGRGDSRRDEAAIWASIVAGFDDVPDDPSPRWPAAEDLPSPPSRPGGAASPGPVDPPATGSGRTPGEAMRFRFRAAPKDDGGSAGPLPRRHEAGASGESQPPLGPRDHSPAEPDEHFVPPPPPPLPHLDVTAKLAWVGLVGGPLFFVLSVLLGAQIGGWSAIVAGLAFAAGFVTLVARLRERPDVDDGDDGAVV